MGLKQNSNKGADLFQNLFFLFNFFTDIFHFFFINVFVSGSLHLFFNSFTPVIHQFDYKFPDLNKLILIHAPRSSSLNRFVKRVYQAIQHLAVRLLSNSLNERGKDHLKQANYLIMTALLMFDTFVHRLDKIREALSCTRSNFVAVKKVQQRLHNLGTLKDIRKETFFQLLDVAGNHCASSSLLVKKTCPDSNSLISNHKLLQLFFVTCFIFNVPHNRITVHLGSGKKRLNDVGEKGLEIFSNTSANTRPCLEHVGKLGIITLDVCIALQKNLHDRFSVFSKLFLAYCCSNKSHAFHDLSTESAVIFVSAELDQHLLQQRHNGIIKINESLFGSICKRSNSSNALFLNHPVATFHKIHELCQQTRKVRLQNFLPGILSKVDDSSGRMRGHSNNLVLHRSQESGKNRLTKAFLKVGCEIR
mmetsp:Transcript_28603/g.72960  ORF Transcript_28603/g.72960 Transcript_28603/m.72960 type:complete len:419 (-) Transcript_28603:1282-2538(-)